MPGLGIFSWFSYQLPIQVRLEFIKNVGFNATMLIATLSDARLI